MPQVTPVAEGEPDPATQESAQKPPPAAPPAPPGTDVPPPPPAARPPRQPRPPSAYSPDLRPMLILAAMLVGVIIGWLVLSPIILPAR